MAALRRVTAYLRTTSRVLLSSKKATVNKTSKWTTIVYSGVTSFTVGAGLCAVPFRQTENLTHDAMIRRAASLVTDSSSTFLSQTTLALTDALTEYAKAVHTLIALYRRYLSSLGKLSQADEDAIWQVIISQRVEVSDRQDECQRFESTWFSAVRLCETASEAAYASGAENASITGRMNIQVAQSHVEEAQKLSKDADKTLAETKVMEVERMATSSQGDDDEDVPEAYLRED